MRPPGKVMVGAQTYELQVDADETGKQDADGVTFARFGRIYLAPGMSEGYERTVVLHELMHACFDDAKNGGPFDKEELEELACTTLAPRLLEVLRRNPRLVEYLTG